MIFDKKILGEVSYETPQVKTLDFMSEGMLCSSGGFDMADSDYDPENNLGEI